jgi:hypothetical protein
MDPLFSEIILVCSSQPYFLVHLLVKFCTKKMMRTLSGGFFWVPNCDLEVELATCRFGEKMEKNIFEVFIKS